MQRGSIRRGVGTACVAVLLLAGMAEVAGADTYAPTRKDDPQPDGCKPSDCTLREAVIKAGNHQGVDEVVLGGGTYRLELPPDGGTFGDSGQLVVSDNTTIRGLGPAETAIASNGLDRVMTLGFPRAKLEGLTLRGGDASGDPEHANIGGGILAIGDKATLLNVVVKRNAAQFGGGIAAFSPNLVIKSSTISRNVGQEGGGIDTRAAFIQASTRIRSSTISGNAAANGGGLMADGTASSTQIAPIVTAQNSTFAENEATNSAGGIAGGQHAIVVLDNSTVAYNKADADNAGGGVGGGIFEGGDASFQFGDSLLAVNTTGTTGADPACHGHFDAAGALIDATGSNPGCFFEGLFQPDVTTTPKVGPLADYGGPTKTVSLLTGSPAIGLSLSCPNADQRGKPRPEEDCDAGSYERKQP